MTILTSRQQNMLQQLMEKPDYIPMDQFVQTYGISARTVRHDLLMLEEWLKEYGVFLNRDRKLGFQVVIDSDQWERLNAQLKRRPEYVDSKLRVRLLLKRLLAETKVRMEDLLEEFKISKNTLLLDVAEVKEWLAERKLELKRESGWAKVKGSELHKRHAYLELLRTEITDEKILQFVLDGEEPLGNQPWNFWFRTEDAHFLFDAVKQLQRRLAIELSDAGCSALILHLLMAMERLKKEHAIKMDGELLLELQATKEFHVVRETMVDSIERYFAVQIPQEEIGYITQHVLGAQKKHEPSSEDSQYVQLAKQIVISVEQELGHPLQRMEQIVQGLAIHLKPAIYRAKFGLNTSNPLLGQLEAEFGTLLAIIERIVAEVLEPHEVALDRDEIGYIMMHIGSGLTQHSAARKKRIAIICSSGLGTSSILHRRMDSLFPHVEVVGEYSYKGSKEISVFEADAALTTIDIAHPMAVPWLKVSPLLPEADQDRVVNFLGIAPPARRVEAETIQLVNAILQTTERHADIRNRNQLLEELLHLFQGRSRTPQGRHLTALMPVQSIRLQLEEADWEAAVRLGNRLLCERGLTGLQYEEKLVDMVWSQKHHFIIHDGIAFPHASMLDGVWETGFSLLTFRRPLLFGPAQQPVWLIITLAAVDKDQHVKALSTLLDAFNDTAFMTLLKQTEDAQRVWQELRQREGL
ncbi:BglG family transcription antiterminator [Paenibacillus sp. J2TS4]|uniref:BglG family transcription antiterminator n=1 Tax=Paenibacillus sp. J2TS4 TaxID=2807194 RepID=UPI001B184BF3|nr:BglG family transcription antiterminator [Paenibacillus sp. J2TS4]GIP35099.1 sugar transporter [Paenibacillus sp. J2TS4]